jgi:cytochrome c oxidase subunit IV
MEYMHWNLKRQFSIKKAGFNVLKINHLTSCWHACALAVGVLITPLATSFIQPESLADHGARMSAQAGRLSC